MHLFAPALGITGSPPSQWADWLWVLARDHPAMLTLALFGGVVGMQFSATA